MGYNGVLSNSLSAVSSNGTTINDVVFGLVTLQKDTGEHIYYRPTADTDAARGLALEAAMTAVAAGETVLLGPGTYNVNGTTYHKTFTIPTGASVIGSGRGSTVVTTSQQDSSGSAAGDRSVFVMKSDSTLQSLSIICSNYNQYTFACSAIPSEIATDILIDDVYVEGCSDFPWIVFAGSTIVIQNSEWRGLWDGFINIATNGKMVVQNCIIKMISNPSVYGDVRAFVNLSSGGIIESRNNDVYIYQDHEVEGSYAFHNTGSSGQITRIYNTTVRAESLSGTNVYCVNNEGANTYIYNSQFFGYGISHGGSVLEIHDSTIDTRAVNKTSIEGTTNGILLDNVSIYSHSSATNSITTTSDTVTLNGTVTANKPPDSDTVFTGGGFFINSTTGVSSSRAMVLQLQSPTNLGAPADATVYRIRESLNPTTLAFAYRMYIPRTGIIESIRFVWSSGGLSSGETFSCHYQLNGGSDVLISNALVASATINTVTSSPALSVTAGDYLTFSCLTPTWATNPTNSTAYVDVLMTY